MPIIPARLNYGDTIGIIAPASAPLDPESIDRSVAFLERLGFKTRLAPNVRKRWGFLAGSDRHRAGDLMKMFTDRKVQAIMCVRGGYGTARLLPLLDYRAIRANPKIFIGYSDITSLHCAFLAKSNLVSFHGPMLSSDFLKKDSPDFTLQSFLKTLTQPSPPGSICDCSPRRRAAFVTATSRRPSPSCAAASLPGRSSAAISACSAPRLAHRISPLSRTVFSSSKTSTKRPTASTGC
ncbi:MAG: LD-carboxypeptidase [Verrucomicrobia bacterium]|nr:LD-carboxypeptidase [Verrucomicrobiota bacterium]